MIPNLDIPDFVRLSEMLATPKRVIITTHHKPDGDAMGSSLALYNFLKQGGHEPLVITSSDYPEFLHWMTGNNEVCIYPRNVQKAEEAISKAELIFCLDFNQPQRLDKLVEVISRSTAVKVLIDHHLEPDNFCELNFSFQKSCATCEILYHILIKLNKSQINKQVGECLYTGIVTDTGSFRFSSTSPDTLRVAAELMAIGVESHKVHDRVFDEFSANRTRFLGYCLSNKLVILPELRVAYISVTMEEQSKFRNQTGDTEGIVNYALAVKNMVMAAFFYEQEGIIKISFRSKADFSVRDIAAQHFNGGGHLNAAGGRSTLSLDDTIQKFKDILPSLKDLLLNTEL